MAALLNLLFLYRVSCALRVIVIVLIVVEFAAAKDVPVLNMNLTRRDVTTHLGLAANLGCYANEASSPLSYTWSKDNRSVTQSSNVKVYANLLVVTPEKESDFGVYVCSVSNGVTSTRCNIFLVQGWNKNDTVKSYPESPKGCINISVLMPILAVAVVSVLFNIHLLIRWRRRGQWTNSQGNQVRFATDVVIATSVEDDDPETEPERIEKKKTKKLKLGKFFKKRRRSVEETEQQNEEKESDHEENEGEGNEHKSDDGSVKMDNELKPQETSANEEDEYIDETGPAPLDERHRKPGISATELPRLADFFVNDDGDEIDGDDGGRRDSERESVNSEEPLVSHYMEKMDFEVGGSAERIAIDEQ